MFEGASPVSTEQPERALVDPTIHELQVPRGIALRAGQERGAISIVETQPKPVPQRCGDVFGYPSHSALLAEGDTQHSASLQTELR